MSMNDKAQNPFFIASSKLLPVLLERYPDLSATELKICLILSMNVGSRKIAQMTDRSIRTIEYTRNNIRKKMKLATGENLVKHIIMISGGME